MIRLLFFLAVGATHLAAAEPSAWHPTTWQGEAAYVSTCGGWKAVVSLARARLVHFGPEERALNLLFAPTRRDDDAGWGGHRLWLGPQAAWPKLWPPPAAWEASAAPATVTPEGTLRLTLSATGRGWPSVTRTYQWVGARLLCGAELAGGERPAQVIQIFQVTPRAVITVRPQPTAALPNGYVQLPSMATPRLTAKFPPPPHAQPDGEDLRLRHLGQVQKLGFPVQPLLARDGEFGLKVYAGTGRGEVAGDPDAGFGTQIYLGGSEPFTELEQLSPAYAPGHATFTVELEGVRFAAAP